MSDDPRRIVAARALLRRIPELRGLPVEEQRALWERAAVGAMTRPAFLLMLGGYLFVIVGLPILAQRVLVRVTWWPVVAGALVVATVGLGMALFVAWPVWYARRQLWRLLPHLCDGCGYDLTGNASGRCPECGRTIEPPSPRPVE